jgi:hypothetical protein
VSCPRKHAAGPKQTLKSSDGFGNVRVGGGRPLPSVRRERARGRDLSVLVRESNELDSETVPASARRTDTDNAGVRASPLEHALQAGAGAVEIVRMHDVRDRHLHRLVKRVTEQALERSRCRSQSPVALDDDLIATAAATARESLE